ncbi:hypothetical protein EVG20_g842 [Dentipellis fragilis]|uniref:Uncharacterized protein n=1 Tax=Dentipellis fragilis TaxID=205917 RepID=A0A4Y9ZFD9_9AGAM|nr:hypothetical protein EVG20_g842 [Dentipellis fragilis]
MSPHDYSPRVVHWWEAPKALSTEALPDEQDQYQKELEDTDRLPEWVFDRSEDQDPHGERVSIASALEKERVRIRERELSRIHNHQQQFSVLSRMRAQERLAELQGRIAAKERELKWHQQMLSQLLSVEERLRVEMLYRKNELELRFLTNEVIIEQACFSEA